MQVREVKGVFPSSGSAKQRHSACNPLLRDWEKASPCLLGILPLSQASSKGELCPTAKFLLCFWGALAPGCPAVRISRDAVRLIFPQDLPRRCFVLFLFPQGSSSHLIYPLGIKSGRAPISPTQFPQSLSPHLRLAVGGLGSSEKFLFKANILSKLNSYTEHCPNQKITN